MATREVRVVGLRLGAVDPASGLQRIEEGHVKISQMGHGETARQAMKAAATVLFNLASNIRSGANRLYTPAPAAAAAAPGMVPAAAGGPPPNVNAAAAAAAATAALDAANALEAAPVGAPVAGDTSTPLGAPEKTAGEVILLRAEYAIRAASAYHEARGGGDHAAGLIAVAAVNLAPAAAAPALAAAAAAAAAAKTALQNNIAGTGGADENAVADLLATEAQDIYNGGHKGYAPLAGVRGRRDNAMMMGGSRFPAVGGGIEDEEEDADFLGELNATVGGRRKHRNNNTLPGLVARRSTRSGRKSKKRASRKSRS